MFLVKSAVIAAAMTAAFATIAQAQSQIWIGLEGKQDGFLLDTDSGKLTMTGACAVALAPAARQGEIWTSHNDTVEEVGRISVRLQQTFRFDIDGDRARVTVTNPERGGPQTFDMAVKPCGDGRCAALEAQPAC